MNCTVLYREDISLFLDLSIFLETTYYTTTIIPPFPPSLRHYPGHLVPPYFYQHLRFYKTQTDLQIFSRLSSHRLTFIKIPSYKNNPLTRHFYSRQNLTINRNTLDTLIQAEITQ